MIKLSLIGCLCCAANCVTLEHESTIVQKPLAATTNYIMYLLFDKTGAELGDKE